jgi:hypothetical protein
VLGLTAIASAHGVGTLHGLVAGAYLLFAVSWMNPSYVWALGVEYRPYEFVEASWVRRAGITMLPHEAEEYSRLMQLVEKVQPTRPMLALPDCPEVYFLSARPNPTRYTYEFLSPRPFDGRLVLGLVDQHEVGVIVVNREPHFSPALDAGVLDELERRFPYSAETGRFLVRWRL